jgi:hypothetical protein
LKIAGIAVHAILKMQHKTWLSYKVDFEPFMHFRHRQKTPVNFYGRAIHFEFLQKHNIYTTKHKSFDSKKLSRQSTSFDKLVQVLSFIA